MSPESHNGSQWVLIMCQNHTRILNTSIIPQWVRNVSRISQWYVMSSESNEYSSESHNKYVIPELHNDHCEYQNHTHNEYNEYLMSPESHNEYLMSQE